ncbi:MAG: phosphatidylserine decarboxylase [Thiohalobacteraceae bacterium]|nr:phosphatidylserine decarboxylase [Gammaproteobacteria bacterium]
MAASRYPLIAREGWPVIFLLGCAGVFVFWRIDWAWSLPLWGGVLILLFMFRDPPRQIPSNPQAIVSPADGTVTAIETVTDPYLEREAQQVSIRMPSYGVFSTRAPAEGKMLEPRRIPASDGHQGVWLRTDEGDDLVIVMHRGPLHNAPRCYVGFGDRVGQGQRCGFITLGSTIELYLPANCRMKVQPGDHVRAGTDIIGLLVHK